MNGNCRMKDSKKNNLFQSVIDVVGFLLVCIFVIIKAIVSYILPNSYRYTKRLEGEIIVITGGGGGLGRLLALRLARLKATIVLWDINDEAIEETVELIRGMGGIAHGFKCDLANKDEVFKVANITKTDVGEVTILVNNAGVVSGKLLLDTPDYLIKRTFEVNILAHFWTVKAFLPTMMKKNHGHIVTVASMAGYVGINKLVDYCSSKYAAIGFMEALRVELDAHQMDGVKTTLICPYFIKSTGMFDNVNSRFLPTLKPNDVADRIVEGIRQEEVTVLIPKIFTVGLILKLLVPWTCISMFLRGLVPDPVPSEKTISCREKENFIAKPSILNKHEMLSEKHNERYQ